MLTLLELLRLSLIGAPSETPVSGHFEGEHSELRIQEVPYQKRKIFLKLRGGKVSDSFKVYNEQSHPDWVPSVNVLTGLTIPYLYSSDKLAGSEISKCFPPMNRLRLLLWHQTG